MRCCSKTKVVGADVFHYRREYKGKAVRCYSADPKVYFKLCPFTCLVFNAYGIANILEGALNTIGKEITILINNIVKIIFRADYWKSNERKYCDFCKCWIADNKPSIQFHENGRRHKSSVAKRLTEISKKSAKDEKTQQKVDVQMRQMEDAAMKAYMMDISQNSDITSRSINAANEEAAAAAAAAASAAGTSGPSGPNGPSGPSSRVFCGPVDPMMPPVDPYASSDEENRHHRKGTKKAVPEEPVTTEGSLWCEAVEDGNTYYWNVKTNESVWVAPKEGFLTLDEYNKINKQAIIKQEEHLRIESNKFKDNADEIAAKYQREKLKKYKVKDAVKEEKVSDVEPVYSFQSPDEAAQPFGQWQTVVKKEVKHVDLQLPEAPQPLYTYQPTLSLEPSAVKKFKEKTISSLDLQNQSSSSSAVPATFKKRKIMGGSKNVRQRVDDD